MFERIANAIYNFFAAVVNTFQFSAIWAWGWEWTERRQVINPNDNPDRERQISDLFKMHMKDQGIKAGQFALRVNGALQMSTAYTWAEPGYRTTETNSLMRIASCSKIFTTAAIFDLIARGMLSGGQKVFSRLGITENDPRVSNNLEPFDPRVKDITVGHLIMHRGGWDYETSPNDWVFHLKEIGRAMGLHSPPTKMDFAKYMFNTQLAFAPGADRKYSNIGFVLLGLVIEKTSGMTYMEYLNSRLLVPMGVNDVFVGRTRLADRRDGEVIYEDPFIGPDATLDPNDPHTAPLPYGGDGAMTEVMDSGGGLITSANSLSRFIFTNNVFDENMTGTTGTHGRSNGRKDGGMPGTTAVAESFIGGSGKTNCDIALIFNQRDKGYKLGLLNSVKLDSLVTSIKNSVNANF